MVLGLLGSVGVVLVTTWLALGSGQREEPWDVSGRPSRPRPRPSFAELHGRDANFSSVLLEDFLVEFYSRAQISRGDSKAVAALRPYIADGPLQALVERGRRRPSKVDGVIVGRMDIVAVRQTGRDDVVVVEYETNYTETLPRSQGAVRVGFYSHERWTFRRSSDATSPPPSKTLAFNCPSCGAPVECDEAGACTHCGETNRDARHAWRCVLIRQLQEETRPPTLTGYAQEVHGANHPIPAGTQERYEALIAKHHAGDVSAFDDRVREVYHGLNDAWSSLRWDDARSLLSDRLWLSWRYWIHAYEEQHLRNEMRDAKVEKVVVQSVGSDPFFDTIVVRIYASAIDVTTHVPSGSVVGGNPRRPRAYSEYWTFIRPTGRDGSQAEDECPNCGAPLEVEMAGRCSACRVKVQRGGDFDWGLAKVQQDEAYRP